MPEPQQLDSVAVLIPKPPPDHSENLIPGSQGPRIHQLDKALEAIVDKSVLATILWTEAKNLRPWAIKYIYDRLAGLPVQRHEAKLLSQVDDTAQLLAKAYGLSVDEVRDRARQIAQGT